jgi:hypothetical protein
VQGSLDGEAGRIAAVIVLVQHAQLLEEDRPRPGIRDDVMVDPHQPVLVLADPDQSQAQQRSALEIERNAALPGEEIVNRGIRIRGLGQVDQRQVDRPGGMDQLHELPVALRKSRPQRFVAANHVVDAASQRDHVQWSLDLDCHGLDVERLLPCAGATPRALLAERGG